MQALQKKGYKQTEMGQIPNEWSIKTLEKLANLRRRQYRPHI
jgi:hypothetical protein